MFSTTDDIVTSFRLLELFFDVVLVDMIRGYTKLYSHREKAGISFEITYEKIHLFLSMLLVSGCHKLPDCKGSNSMPCNTFQRILQNLHLCDNEQFHK